MAETMYRSSIYCGALLQRLKLLYDKGQLCDFSLVVGSVEVKIHSAVLFSASSYFRLLMEQGSLHEPRFSVQTCNIECLRVLIQFMYTGSLMLSEENIWITLTLASQFDIPEAVELCQQYLHDFSQKSHSGEPPDVAGSQGAAVESIAARLKVDAEQVKANVPGELVAPPSEVNLLPVKKELLEELADDPDGSLFPEMLPNYDEDELTDEDYVPAPTAKTRKPKKARTHVEDAADLSTPTAESSNALRKRGRPKGSKNKPKDCIEESSSSYKLKNQLKKESGKRKAKRVYNQRKKNNQLSRDIPEISAAPVVREKLHVCTVCDKRFGWISLLLAHQRSHWGVRYKNLLVHHLIKRAVSGRSRTLSCSLCIKTFKMAASREAHMLKVHRDSSFAHNCLRCSRKSYLHHKNLLIHRFRRHRKHTKKPLHSCTICERQFLYLGTWLQHKKTSHSGDTELKSSGKLKLRLKKAPYKRPLKPGERRRGRPPGKPNSATKSGSPWACQERSCTYTFLSKNELARHMITRHPLVAYACPVAKCKFSTNIKSQLEKHCEKFHNPSCRNVCEICGKMFPRNFRLKMHMFSKHRIKDPDLPVYSCKVDGCKYSSVLKDGVSKHMRKHEPEKPFICTICGKHFKTERSVEKHTGKVHLGIRNYVCDICGMAYGDESELKIHIVRHSDTKTFPCEHCDYATFDKGNYKTHLYCKHNIKLEEHMKIFECSMCDFTTSIKYQYSDHMRVHYQVRDIPCLQCNKKFITRKSMRSHVMKCHNPKDYHCTVCSYSSADKSKVREHIRIMHTHRHFKPYKCPYCGFQCATGGNCRKHVKHKHKDREVTYIKLDITELAPSSANQVIEDSIHHGGRAERDCDVDYTDVTGGDQEDYVTKETSGMALHHQPQPRQPQHHQQQVHHHISEQQSHVSKQHDHASEQQSLVSEQHAHVSEQHSHIPEQHGLHTPQPLNHSSQMVQALNMSIVSPYDSSSVSWQTLNAMMQQHHMNL